MRKKWVTLYTCASTRNMILDVIPSLSAESFIRSFRRFISRRGCPDSIISDNGKNFVSKGSQNFISNLNVRWHFNLPLTPWHGGFFEHVVRSAKDLLKKDLQNNKLTDEEMQAVLLEIEMIISNRPLTHLYPDTTEMLLTPNHLVFARTLNHNSCNDRSINKVFFEGEIHTLCRLIEHFWDRWRKEYTVNLRVYHSTKQKVSSNLMIKLKDLVLVHDDVPADIYGELVL